MSHRLFLHSICSNARVWAFLEQVDEAEAARCRSGGCPHCGAALHSATYPRKPHGLAPELRADARRCSLCCCRCRRRVTPPSARFFGRRFRVAPLFAMVSALVLADGARLESISRRWGIPVRTLSRWRQWWRETFVQTRLWRWKRGELAMAPGEAPLRILLRRIRGRGVRSRLLRALIWLLPWTGFCALGAGPTLPAESVSDRLGYAPYQNGKCEVWWAAVEGRLMAMLEGVEPLTLDKLNHATVAWVERDYHRRVHRELATTPLARLLDSDDASRPCPDSDVLTAAFRITVTRILRRSDATISVEGVRYQVPAPWRHLRELHLRVARWNLASVELVDARSAERLCTLYPLDKRANAGALRRRTVPGGNDGGANDGGANADGGEHEPAPLLKRILHDQDATGLPPLWLPHTESPHPHENEDHGDPS